MDEMALTARTIIGSTPIVRKGHRGSALIAIIAAILLFSVLAATLLPLVSSSRQQTAFQHLADQAYFLAESGYRMALHQYRQAQTLEQKVAALQAMNGQQFELEGVGSFKIQIYSYYFVLTNGAAATDNSCEAVVAGSLPPELLENEFGLPQKLFIGNQPFAVNLSSPDDDGKITIRLEAGALFGASISRYTIAYPFVGSADFDAETGFLSYESGGGDLFPPAHGRLIVGGRVLTYNYNNRDGNRFEGIRDPSAPSQAFVLGIEPNTPIILTNFSRLHSTGVVGQGGSGVRRELIYHAAFPQEGLLWEVEETFSEASALDSWQTTDGTVTLETADNNQALRFETVGPDGALTAPAAAAADRFTGYRGLTGGFLSYDVQVKMEFQNSLFVETNDDDLASDNIPSFAGGISFRLGSTGEATPLSLMDFNGYGLSIVRGYAGFQLPGDALEAGPLVVLWQQTGGIHTRNWLAYANIVPPTGGAALLVRLHEAVLLPFHEGGPAAIRTGDRIYGANSGTMGTVLSSPILSNGAWNTESAAGTLLLNNVTKGNTFQQGETLLVIGPSNSTAKVLNSVTTDTKANVIRVYRANLADYPRIVGNQRLQWPPDNEADEEDHTSPFHLLSWNEINVAINEFTELQTVPSSSAPNSILRAYHPSLVSKPLGASSVAELGLHALGDGATDIYFDDFAFRLIYPLREEFASPLQQ